MCRRFMALEVTVTGSANDVGLAAAGRPIGLAPLVSPWQAAHVAAELAEATIAGPIERPDVSRLGLGVEATWRKGEIQNDDHW